MTEHSSTSQPPASATALPVESIRAQELAREVERQFREREAGVFFVRERVVRRVLQNQLGIANPWLPPPHRQSCSLEKDRLLWLVSREELDGLPPGDLPPRIILIARPEEERLARYSRDDLLRFYWRRLFHARIDLELERRTAPARMTIAVLRQRIAAIGQTQFDEIRSVLLAEQLLRRPDDSRQVYAEFVALYHELQEFAPDLVPVYFPSLDDAETVLRVIGPDCDAAALFEASRPPELSATVSPIAAPVPEPVPTAAGVERQPHLDSRSPRKYAALLRRAEKFRARGNQVRAALVLREAYERAPLNQIDDAWRMCQQEIEQFVNRLQKALELSPEHSLAWRDLCERLLPAARRGFWNANARLLYDLQQVCLDFEREIYRVDLLSWALSRGRKPLKRPLPNQRVVLASKHLRSAVQRVPSVLIDASGRRELSELLHAAADSARHALRRRFEPLVADTLTAARFTPQTVVERVAFQKVVHELLDGVVQRGFLTLGDLRDAISRNQLKMPDLASAKEFVAGDPLLKADELLSTALDGVYQPGPFYLRWLQRANSLAFGIPGSRLITKYIALPFGLSFLTLMAFEEVAHLLFGHHPPPVPVPVGEAAEIASAVAAAPVIEAVHSPPHPHLIYSHTHLLWLGFFIFALIHIPRFRAAVLWLLKKTAKLLRIGFLEIPKRLATFPLVEAFLRSFPMLLFRRFLLAPIVVTAIFWKLLPALGIYEPFSGWWACGIFLGSTLLLSSRVGRDSEEVAREYLARTWYRIRTHLVVGLFTLIVDAVRWLMDGIERILYAVGDWLRFRSGETQQTLAIKAVLGLAWVFIHGVIRFLVTLLIEPQINPIKHFPVVTVSHKLIMGTLAMPLAGLLQQFHFERATALALSPLILSGIPGVFGFLAWELKENWKLYAANRPKTLRPVQVGSHGETLLRLLSPGFHSGTIPKLFARRRRAARREWTARTLRSVLQVDNLGWYTEQLNHQAESLRHFLERELLGLLHESRTFRDRSLTIGSIELATNRVRAMICAANDPQSPLILQFSEQSGWIIARLAVPGWIAELTEEDRNVFRTALAGLYKLGSVGLVHEQIERRLVPPPIPSPEFLPADDPPPLLNRPSQGLQRYDVSPSGLVVWLDSRYEIEVQYPLDDSQTLTPRPRSLARAAGLSPVPIASIVFDERPLAWDEWQAYWEIEQSPLSVPRRPLPEVELLPQL